MDKQTKRQKDGGIFHRTITFYKKFSTVKTLLKS